MKRAKSLTFPRNRHSLPVNFGSLSRSRGSRNPLPLLELSNLMIDADALRESKTQTQSDPTIVRLEDQIDWYDRKSGHNQQMFKWLKTATIVAAVAIPLCAGLGAQFAIISGVLGAFIALVEGIQQLNQYQQNWITYRSTCEALKHEKYLFLANAGPYGAAENPKSLLAERVESLVSQEHAKWAATQQQPAKAQVTPGAR